MFDFSLLPMWYQLFLVGCLGAIMASFINVVAYRMHTNASLAGRSRCFSCGNDLQWYELLPVISYTALRGRCRSCGAAIAARDVIVEVVMAAVFIILYSTTSSLVLFGFSATLFVLLCAVVLYDLTHLIIPNELVIAIGTVAVGILALEYLGGATLGIIAGHLIAAAISFLVYASLWVVSKGRWIGFGDAKLALPLGLLLSPAGAFTMIVLSFWVGAAIAIAMLVFQKIQRRLKRARYARTRVANVQGYLTMKSEIPFAPFLVVAFALVYVYGVDVLTLTSYVLGN